MFRYFTHPINLLNGLLYLFFFLSWGSFLNMLAYRLIHGNLFAVRSFCQSCKYALAWYDEIPVLSFFLLRGKCRICKAPISFLHPFIELLTAAIFLILVWRIEPRYMIGFGIFCSALIITISTDLDSMLISRFVTLCLVPVGFALASFGALRVTLIESLIGAFSAGVFLFFVAKVFKLVTGKDGMGQGDIDLLIFIGSFLGYIQWWMSLLIGSLIGSLVSIFILILNGSNWSRKIPFGPFLAAGAIIDLFLHDQIIFLLFG